MTVEFLLYPLIGILSGFLSGFFGVGGGIVIVPSLHFLYKSLGYSDEIAIPISLGTALACIIVNALSAIPVHHKNGTISWVNFRKLLLGIVIGPVIGALISVELDKELFKKIFALFIFLISLRLFFKSSEPKMEKPISYTIALPFGGFVGTLSSLFGVGGGIFIGPFLRFMGENIKRAAGTSLVCTLPVGIIGALSYIYLGINTEDLPDYSVGYVNYLSLFFVAIFSSVFSRIGAQLTQKVNDKAYQILYALQLLPVFIYWLLA